MDAKKSPPDMDVFEKAMAPAIEWYQKHCGPHQTIIISNGLVRLTSDEMGLPFDAED